VGKLVQRLDTDMNSKRGIVIIGSGPTGLAAAYRLAKNGYRVTVLEKRPYVGGITATVRHKGMSVDLGPHRFTPHTPEVKDFVLNLLGDKVTVRKQQSHIYLWERFLTYPFSMGEILTKTDPTNLVRIGFSYLGANLKQLIARRPVNSYLDYMRLNFGPFLAESVFCSIAEKTWGKSASELSVDLAKQRVALENLFKTAVNVLFKRKSDAYQIHLTPSPDTFYYFKDGFGELSEALAREIKKAGGEIILGAEAKSIAVEDSTCCAVVFGKAGKEERLDCDWVIATNPVTRLIPMLGTSFNDQATKAALGGLGFMNLRLVYLILDRPKINDDISMFFPAAEFPFGRIFEQKNYDEGMAPAGKTVLGVEITCRDDEETWRMEDEDLAELVGRQLEKTGLIKKDEIGDYFSLRFKDVYPIYDLHYKENTEILFCQIAKVENLIANGRLGLFAYNNTHHSLEMGFLAADHIMSGKRKAEKWEKDRELFDTYRIVE